MTVRWVFLLFISFLITACDTIYGEHGFIHNRNFDYVREENRPPLRIPPPLSAANISDQYNIYTDPHFSPPSLLPPGSLVWQMQNDLNMVYTRNA